MGMHLVQKYPMPHGRQLQIVQGPMYVKPLASPLCALLVLREGQPAIQRLKITDVFLVGVPGSLLHRNRGLLSFNL